MAKRVEELGAQLKGLGVQPNRFHNSKWEWVWVVCRERQKALKDQGNSAGVSLVLN